MAPPQLTDQILGIQAMPLEPTAHSQPSQRNRSSDDLIHRALKVIQTPGSGVNLQGVRTQLLQHGPEVLKTDAMIRGCDQPERAGRQTAPAAVATIANHSRLRINGLCRTNRLAGPRAIRRAERRVKRSFAEMSISTIADADHQPWTPARAFISPLEPQSRRSHDREICRHINTVDAGNGVEGAEIGNGCQVLVAGAANQLDPTPLCQGIVTGKAETAGCQRSGDQTPRS